jgi:metallo-beta-lactamase family protein
MLLDSARIQEKDVEFVNKRRAKQGKNLFEPLYTEEDAKKTIAFFWFELSSCYEITPEIILIFFDAGHILGSSIVFLTIKEGDRIFNFAFSGDLGRKNLPILQDPDKIPDVDF